MSNGSRSSFGFALLMCGVACSSLDTSGYEPDPNPQGHQSGTEEGSSACEFTDTPLSLESDWHGVPVAGLTKVDGAWWALIYDDVSYERVLKVRIENVNNVVQREFYVPGRSAGCGSTQLMFTADIHLSLEGLIGPMIVPQSRVTVGPREPGVLERGEPRLHLDVSLAEEVPHVGVRLEWNRDRYEIYALDRPNRAPLLAGAGEFRAYTLFGQTPPLTTICSTSEPAEKRSFVTADDALDAVVGAWAVCDSPTQPPVTGVMYSSDFTWHTISGEDVPRLETGFGKAGKFRLRPGSESNGAAGLFDLVGDMGLPAAGLLMLSESGNTFVPSRTLVRMDGPVAPAPAIPFAVGERAGRAACDAPESGTAVYIDNGPAALEALEGRWAICGSSRELSFDSSGHVHVMDAAGNSVSSFELELTPSITGGLTNIRVDSESWDFSLSEQPRKAYLVRYMQNPTEYAVRKTILSALPPR